VVAGFSRTSPLDLRHKVIRAEARRDLNL